MKRLIATFSVATALALAAASYAGASPLAKEGEPRDGADDPIDDQIELVGKEDELRDGEDDVKEDELRNGDDDVVFSREDELRDGADDDADDPEDELRDGNDDGADDRGGTQV